MSGNPIREELLFASALALAPAERTTFLSRECGGDAALLARLLALLSAHDGAQTLGVAASQAPVHDERPGELIGRYKLLQKIGEGACGVVWMAEQEQPVRRRVALKILKLGMDTRAVVTRFEAERQALALMDHPNIAKVLDGGATEQGRPYFVMELVRGVPITRFCDEHRLAPTARVELFIQICHAIQHAHQKGIIHRDIKPSNVLVALHEGTPLPAVIDFGIAKATQGRLTEATLFTAVDQVLGTPVYMSPEQAEYNTLDIDTRSDIYSLGVLLYELLTGRPPFDAKSIEESGLDNFRRMIREVEPPQPSLCIRTLAQEEQRKVAQRRGIPPAQLPAALKGDLDWIVMKAMEKNRLRRYQTANAFAMDLVRYLRNEPVVARPPGTLYRAGKFVRRHRMGVAAGATATIALIIGIIASTAQAVRATRAERAANQERTKAVAARTQADDLLEFMIGEFRAELKNIGKLDLLDKVSDRATGYFASIEPADLNDQTLAQHARVLVQIGETRLSQGRTTEAAQAFSRAHERAASLAARHPRDCAVLYGRGQTEYWMGAVHWKRGELEAAQRWWTRYRDTAAEIVSKEPDRQAWRLELAAGLHNLAALRMQQGELAAAREDFLAKLATLRAAQAAAPNDLDLQFRVSDTESWLGSLAERQGDFPEALARFTNEASVLESVVRADPGTMRWRFERQDSLSFRAGILSITGDVAGARSLLAEARRLAEELVAHDRSNRDWLLGLLRMQHWEAALLLHDGNREAAAAVARSLRIQLQTLSANAENNRSVRAHLASAWKLEAEVLEASEPGAAAEAAAHAIDVAEGLVRASVANDGVIAECARAHVIRARIEAARGNSALARQHASRALELLERRHARSTDWRILDPAARALALLDRHEESREIIMRLERLGYRPLASWAEPMKSVSVRTN